MIPAPILELRHVEYEPPAGYLPALTTRAEVRTVRMWHDPLPAHCDFTAIIVMGGPMGVGDGIPWVDDEIAYLRRALTAGVPVWGVCLGAQMLAAALGALVYTGPHPEVGVHTVTLTEAGGADPVWGPLVPDFPALHWHSDTFELPPDAVLLASSPDYPHQVFRHATSYGVQCHLEADRALATEWLTVDSYRESLRHSIGPGADEPFLAAVEAIQTRSLTAATGLIGRWLDLVTDGRHTRDGVAPTSFEPMSR